MRYGCVVLVMMLAACTLEQKNGRTQAEFHPPLVYPEWNIQRYADEKGTPVCSVNSGPRGVSVFVRARLEGSAGVAVKSNRELRPGSYFSINVNGHHYETAEPFFDAREAERIAEDFLVAEKAWLEWSEMRASDRSPLRTGNILLLDEFRGPFAECRRSVSGK